MLETLGAKVEAERHFEDNFVLDTVEKKLRRTGRLLRLRVTGGDAGLFTFKGQGRISDGVKDREEVECTVSDANHFLKILSELGYAVSFRYQKYRTVFRIDRVILSFVSMKHRSVIFLNWKETSIRSTFLRRSWAFTAASTSPTATLLSTSNGATKTTITLQT